jgi:gamma-glutamyl-gamma-aminobutyrate hydrolase PuuD
MGYGGALSRPVAVLPSRQTHRCLQEKVTKNSCLQDSSHHQAVKNVASRLCVAARSTHHGVVETVELDGA